MKARDVVGRTIVKVNQRRFWNSDHQRWQMDVDSFELDNGTLIWPVTQEGEADYTHDFAVLKKSA